MKKLLSFIMLISTATFLAACSSETTTIIPQEQQGVVLKQNDGTTRPLEISIGRFDNRSDYNNGVFANNTLSQQGLDTLVQALTQTGYYVVMNRSLLDKLSYESELNGYQFKPLGARYVLAASITEFGRRQESSTAIYGLVGKSRTDVAYATVSLVLVDVSTSATVASASGTAKIDITGRKALGTGTNISYDSSQNQRVLSLAIRDAVNNLINVTRYMR